MSSRLPEIIVGLKNEQLKDSKRDYTKIALEMCQHERVDLPSGNTYYKSGY